MKVVTDKVKQICDEILQFWLDEESDAEEPDVIEIGEAADNVLF
jgi:hypothetical protein